MRQREQEVFETVVEHSPVRWKELKKELDIGAGELNESLDFLIEKGFIRSGPKKLYPTPKYEDWN